MARENAQEFESMMDKHVKQCENCPAMMNYNHRLHCLVCELCGYSEDITTNKNGDASYIG